MCSICSFDFLVAPGCRNREHQRPAKLDPFQFVSRFGRSISTARNQPHHGHHDYRSDDGRGEVPDESKNRDMELLKDETTDERADESENYINDATITSSSRQNACEPSRDHSEDKRADKSGRPHLDVIVLLL